MCVCVIYIYINQALCRACEHMHCTSSEHTFSIPEDVGSEDGSADLSVC